MINCIVVDDEPHNLQLLSRYIEQTPGLTVLNGYLNPLKALEAINMGALVPDLVFSDIGMPQMSGLELAELLPDHMCVVFVAGSPDDGKLALEQGAADMLIKPVSYERFVQSVEKVRPLISAKQGR